MLGAGGRARLGVFTVVVVALVVSACGDTRVEESEELFDNIAEAIAQETSTTLPAGPVMIPSTYELYSGDGFEMVLPETWTAFGPDDLDYGALMEGASDEPLLADLGIDVAAMFEQGGVLMAFDFENSAVAFVDNLNVIRGPSSPLSASGLVTIAEKEYTLVGATNVEAEVVTLPAGEAAMVRYQLPDFGSEGVAVTFPGNEYDWVITISVADLDTMTVDPDVVFESFRITP